MFTYQILNHPALGQKVIRKDVAPWGFIFSALWVLYKRIWWKGIVLFCALVTIPSLWVEMFHTESGSLIVPGLIAMFVGIRGNRWYKEKLENDGYEVTAEVEAKSVAQALAIAAKKGS